MHLTVRGELYRVVTVKACFAKWKIPGHLLQVLQPHVTEGVCADRGADFGSSVGGRDQLIVAGNVGSVVTGEKKRRGADTYMHLRCAGDSYRAR